jgi:signal transduction histidine kinase
MVSTRAVRPNSRGAWDSASPTDSSQQLEPSWWFAGAILGLASVGLAAGATRWSMAVTPQLVIGARSAALVLALLLVISLQVAAQVLSDARAVRLATSAGLLAALVGLDLLTGVAPAYGTVAAARFALSLAAAAWALLAVIHTDRSAARQPNDVLVASAAIITLWGFLSVLATAVEPPRGVATLHLVAAIVWVGTGTVLLRGARRETCLLLAGSGWLAIALALSELSRLNLLHAAPWWYVPPAGLRATGLLLAMVGVVATLARHVSERRSALESLELHHAQLQRHRDARERERSHELRNALLAIEGASLTLERSGGELAEDDQRRLSAAMVGGFSHLRRLLEPEPPPDEDVPTDLGELVTQRVELARRRGAVVSLDRKDHVLVGCPPAEVTRILDNLIENAIRHGLASERGCSVVVHRRGGCAVVRVRDHGPGLSAAERGQVFEPGARLRGSVPGEGLGLPLARATARRHGGDLVAVAADGDGACFELTLPVVSGHLVAAELAATSTSHADHDRGSRRAEPAHRG